MAIMNSTSDHIVAAMSIDKLSTFHESGSSGNRDTVDFYSLPLHAVAIFVGGNRHGGY